MATDRDVAKLLWLRHMPGMGRDDPNVRLATAKVLADGRISIPVEIRRRLGAERSGKLFVLDRPDGILLRNRTQAVAALRASARALEAGRDGYSVDDFLARKRVDAERE